MAKTIGWWIVDSNVDELMIENSLKHTLNKVKKIRKRTKALNIELKKYAGLKHYKQYVTIKTEILRNITDNEDTDDEPCVRSAIAADSFILSGVDSQDEERTISHKVKRHNVTKKKLSTRNSEEDDKGEKETEINKKLNKKSKSNTPSNESNKISNNKPKDQEIVEVQVHQNNERSQRKSNRNKSANYISQNKDKDQAEEDKQPKKNENRVQEKLSKHLKTNGLENSNHDEEKIDGQESKNCERLQEKVDKHVIKNDVLESECEDEMKEKSLQVHDKSSRENAKKTDATDKNDERREKENDHNEVTNDLSESDDKEETEKEELEIDERLSENNDKHDETNGNSESDEKEEIEEGESEIVERLSENDDTNGTIIGILRCDDEEEQNEDREDVNNETKMQENGEFLMENDSEEEANVPNIDAVVVVHKKSQPTVKCTEIVTSKYTIVQDKNKKDRSIDKSCEISEIRSDEKQSKANDLLPDASCENSEIPLNESREISEIPRSDSPEVSQDPLDDDEVIELDKQTHEARRVGQLKRLNLLYDNSESESSDSADDFTPAEKKCNPVKNQPPSSQIINDSSDSDESQASQDEVSKKITEVDPTKINKISSFSSTPLHISDCESEIVQKSPRKNSGEAEKVVKTKSASKSLKSQIDEQESADSSDETIAKRNEPRSKVVPTSTAVPSEAESLRYILKNISQNGNKNGDEPDYINFESSQMDCSTLSTSKTQTAQSRVEILSRPIELDEFIEREELKPIQQLSTVNIKNFKNWIDEDGDEEILLMEIPRSIVMDGQLSGKKIVIKREKLKIGDVSYKTIRRHDESLSCILSAGKKGNRFKTANMKPVRSIVVCQESSETSFSSTSFKTPLCQSTPLATSAASRVAGHVPFPNNLKSRNPLMSLNDRSNDRSKLELTQKQRDSSVESEEVFMRRKKHKSNDFKANESQNKDDEEFSSSSCDKKRRKSLPLDKKTDTSKDRSGKKRKRSRNETRESANWQLDNFAL